jgi:hypothetical protein
MTREYDYTLEFYQVLKKASKKEVIKGVELNIYRGYLVKAYRSLAIGQSYYSGMMDTLKRMGCITVMQRGTRGSPSIVALHHPPDAEEFERVRGSGLTGRLGDASLTSRVETLEKRIGGLDIVDAFLELTGRVEALERKTGGT